MPAPCQPPTTFPRRRFSKTGPTATTCQPLGQNGDFRPPKRAPRWPILPYSTHFLSPCQASVRKFRKKGKKPAEKAPHAASKLWRAGLSNIGTCCTPTRLVRAPRSASAGRSARGPMRPLPTPRRPAERMPAWASGPRKASAREGNCLFPRPSHCRTPSPGNERWPAAAPASLKRVIASPTRRSGISKPDVDDSPIAALRGGR